jgi:hypothetical protein
MKPKLFSLLVILASAGMASAATPQCIPGTLASYIELGSGGCFIGQVTVANFGYVAKASSGAPRILPSQIQVSPILGVPATASLSFSAKWQASSGQTQESFITYTVTGPVTSSGELTLQLGTYQPGFGDLSVNEHTPAGNLRVYAQCGEVACSSRTTDTLQYTPPAVVLAVTDQVKLSAILGNTSLTGFTAQFNLCPACT